MSTFGENFTESELQALKTSRCLLDVVRATFFFHCTDAFLALCSLIAHGKNCASPNKKIRRAARQELFSKIAYETFPIKNHASIRLSYFEVVTGLQSLSDRWCKFSYDELLSLVFVLDTKNRGSLSSEEFEEFTELVEAAIYKDPSKHVEAFTALYESLRSNVIALAHDPNIHASLRDKLTALANRARYLQQTPLTMMYSLSEEHNHHCPNSVFVDLLVEMVAFVKQHHLKVEKTAVVDVITGPVIPAEQKHNSPPSSTPSRRNSLISSSSNSPGRANNSISNNISRVSSSDSAMLESQSLNGFTTPVKSGGLNGRRASVAGGASLSKEPAGSTRRSSVKTPSGNGSGSCGVGGSLTPTSASKSRRHSTSTISGASVGSFSSMLMKTESLSPKSDGATPAVDSTVETAPSATIKEEGQSVSHNVAPVIQPEIVAVEETLEPSTPVPAATAKLDAAVEADIASPVKTGVGAADVGVNVDLDQPKKALVVEKLKEFRTKESEINGGLTALDQQLAESQTALSHIQLAKQEVQMSNSGLSPMVSSKPADVTAAACSPSKKVKPINPFSTPVKQAAVAPPPTTPTAPAAAAATVEEPVVAVTAANIDAILRPSDGVKPVSDSDVSCVANDDASVSVISSIAPASVASSRHDNDSSAVFSKQTRLRIDKASVAPRAASAPRHGRGSATGTGISSSSIGGGGGGGGGGANLNNVSSSTISVNGSVRSFSTVGSRPRLLKGAAAGSGDSNNSLYRDHSRYQEPPKAVNMNIFRTPLYRQRHENRNQFDPKNTCWQPTKVSNRYNERFQYPSDLRLADKINSVFYNNMNPR